MKRTLPIRAVAAQTLASLRRGGASLTDLLTDADTRIDDARDRAQLRAILYASLRGIFRYEALLRSLLTKPLPRRHDAVEALLINGLAQLELGIDAAQDGLLAPRRCRLCGRRCQRHRSARLG